MEKGYKPTYLKTINNQLSAILNYAVNYYDLKSNPCHKAGSMGKSHADKMEYWTLDEFNSFEDAIMDKQTSWIAFKILFWTGMRLGEMLALTIGDIDFDNGVIEISKSLARLDGKDKVTPPKTEASKRIITMSQELKQDLQEYISTIYRPTPKKRIFVNITKSYLEHEMKRGIEASGVKKIHLHCLRHSHASGIEVYVAGVTNKFVTVTGNEIRDHYPFESRTEELNVLLERYMTRTKTEPKETAGKKN